MGTEQTVTPATQAVRAVPNQGKAGGRSRAWGRQRLSMCKPTSPATTARRGEEPGGTIQPSPQDEVPPQGRSTTETWERLGKEGWLSDEVLRRDWVGPPRGGGSKERGGTAGEKDEGDTQQRAGWLSNETLRNRGMVPPRVIPVPLRCYSPNTPNSSTSPTSPVSPPSSFENTSESGAEADDGRGAEDYDILASVRCRARSSWCQLQKSGEHHQRPPNQEN